MVENMELSSLAIVPLALGLVVAWINGSNNAANLVGVVVGSNALNVRKALFIASILSFIGAISLGIYVSTTMMRGIVDITLILDRNTLILGVIATFLSALLWMMISNMLGVPMSVHACVIGGLTGFGIAIGMEFLRVDTLIVIFVAWILTPFLASFITIALIKLFNICKRNTQRLKVFTISTLFLALFIPLALTSLKVAAHYKELSVILILLSLAICVSLSMFFYRSLSKKLTMVDPSIYERYVLKVLLIVSMSSMSFSFGANDVANAAGAMAAVMYVHGVNSLEALSICISMASIGLALGVFFGRVKVIEMVGRKITVLTPLTAFTAQLSASIVMLLMTRLGLPVSSSMAMVGGVMGAGLARGLRYMNYRTVIRIFITWFSAIPITAAISLLLFKLLSYLI